MKYIYLFIFSFFSIINNLDAQNSKINWNVINDSINLSPSRIKANGSFVYEKASGRADAQIFGEMTVLLKEQQIFYNNGVNLFKLNYSDFKFLDLDSIKLFTLNDLNQKTFPDSITYHYRKYLYNKLDLNEIIVLISKKNKFELIDGELKIRNPSYINGKICSVSIDNLVLLTAEGELINFSDGDFVNVTVLGKKYMECKTLYNFCYNYFTNDLLNLKDNFATKIKESKIEDLVNLVGPFDKVQLLPNNNKIYIWNKPLPKYYINISTTASSFSRFNSFSNYNLNTSPIFSYTNTYRYLNSNTFGTSSSTSKITQGGEVSTVDEGQLLSLVIDANNKIISVYQERLFAEPSYGLPFRFIAY